jgi:hypothetical protein
MEPGQALTIITTDRLSKQNLPLLCKNLGCMLLECREDGRTLFFRFEGEQGETRVGERENEHILLISICSIMIVPLLYMCRSADTNTLTSWRWVFPETGFLRVFLIPALLSAYALSRLTLSGPRAYAFLFILSGIRPSFVDRA